MKPGLIDTVLDRTVSGGRVGFTRLGYLVRKQLWDDSPADLTGRTVVITGATSGLGLAAAKGLAELGGRIVLVGRNPDKTEAVRDSIIAATGNDNLRIAIADLSLMESVRSLADDLLESEPEIHVLINNAGALFPERSETDEGIELTLATNLLGPFLLTNLLRERLRASAPSRIITVSSGGMYTQGVSLSNLDWSRGEYDGTRAYARAKRAQVILTEMWAEMEKDNMVTANSMHPGWADTPGLSAIPAFRRLMKPILRTAAEGADTIVWMAAALEMSNVSGSFFLDRAPHITNVIPGTDLDEDQRIELWNRLAELTDWDGDL